VTTFARDPDPGVRLAALSALASADSDAAGAWHGADGPDAIDRVIINGLGDGWPEVRRRAATALGTRCQRPGPARALMDSVAKDRELDVRGDALTALVQCNAAGIAGLLAHTWDDAKLPTPLRARAVGLVIALGDKALAATLVGKFTSWRGQALESKESMELAQSAAAAIGQMAPPGAAKVLIEALDDSAFPEIVSAAALALGALGPACPATAKAKLTVLARSTEQSAVAAKRAAAQCGK
jgi:HEAT repeat protein